jgi:hypothetical protein
MMINEGGEAVTEGNERVQNALAEYLDYLEMGGSPPDASHLSEAEREELQELIDALALTQGMAFGLGRRAEAEPARHGELFAELRDALPGDVRIDNEPTSPVAQVGGIEITEGWLVGTFGGRVRVWLLDVATAEELETNSDCLRDLGRAFGLLADTTAIALVGRDHSCLIVRPEDCAPQIHIPSGSLVGRRYKHPIQPVGDAVLAFLNELIPYWDPIPAFEADSSLTLDVPTVSEEHVTAAFHRQQAIGGRARKGNPKKEALLALGDEEIAAVSSIAKGLFDGTIDPESIESEIERMARDQ